MITAVFSRLLLMLCGLIYPAYASHKALRYRNMPGYANWMMYWTVISLFICVEHFTDIFMCWFPFYYELKIAFVLWLLPVKTNGSASIYLKYIRPLLERNELQLDATITRVRERGFRILLDFFNNFVRYFDRFISNIMQSDWFEMNKSVFESLPAIIGKALLPEPLFKIADEFDTDISIHELWEEPDTFVSTAPKRSPSAASNRSIHFTQQDDLSADRGRGRSRTRRTSAPSRDRNMSLSQQRTQRRT